jgi:hypothetical protein
MDFGDILDDWTSGRRKPAGKTACKAVERKRGEATAGGDGPVPRVDPVSERRVGSPDRPV